MICFGCKYTAFRTIRDISEKSDDADQESSSTAVVTTDFLLSSYKKQWMITVTCAIIQDRDKFLICQRGRAMSLPLKWEFPGGKMEPGEDEKRSVIREIREELQLDIRLIRRLATVEYDYPSFRIRLIPFLARVIGGSLQLQEHADAKWISADELDQYDWAPADLPVVAQLKKANPVK